MTGSIITSSKDGGINELVIVQPTSDAGAAGTQHVFEGADTVNECSPNSLVKYLNIRLQIAIKSSEAEFRPGWYEYALIYYENETTKPAVPASIGTNFGTSTLPQTCRNLFRNHMVWSGAFGISVETPIAENIKIKCPPKFCKNQRGNYWIMYHAFRSSKSTDTVTETKNIASFEYKVYI